MKKREGIEIIRARRDDLQGFVEVEKEFKSYNSSLGVDKQYRVIPIGKLSSNYYRNDFFKRLSKKSLFFYFAKCGQEYVGYIYGYIQKMPEGFELRRIGYLDGIIIRQKFRGAGVASLLKNRFLMWLKKKGIKLCQIHVAVTNKQTAKIYKKWGFGADEQRMYLKIK
ncbi:MAG: GNAT family N-acetyltransferase [archaeon]